MKQVEVFIGPCSKFITGQGWTTEIPIKQLEARGYVKVDELQKQVDELTDKLGKVLLGVKADEVLVAKGVEQAVKDTAREILGEISESDILVVNTQEYGEIEVVPMERLKEIIKQKGVEVE